MWGLLIAAALVRLSCGTLARAKWRGSRARQDRIVAWPGFSCVRGGMQAPATTLTFSWVDDADIAGFAPPPLLAQPSRQYRPPCGAAARRLPILSARDHNHCAELLRTPAAYEYPEQAAQAAHVINKWQESMEPVLFARVARARLTKELAEALPVVHAVQEHLAALPLEAGPVTIIDMCSGFGYLSMLLAELLPPAKLRHVLLVDRSWALSPDAAGPQHISSDHLQPSVGWQVPLLPRRCNINKKGDAAKLHDAITGAPGPVLIVGIHLCGRLSIRAIELFNAFPQISLLSLKPCCLPPKSFEKNSVCEQ